MLILVAALAVPAVAKKPAPPPPSPPLADVAADLVGQALLSRRPYDELEHLCDDVGNRLSGTPALDKAIAWAQDTLRADGLANVHTEAVQVPAWVRGTEKASIVTPIQRDLHLLTLGGSPGTAAGGIDADVVVVTSFAELETKGDAVAGKIVLFDVPFTTYGETVAYRVNGPVNAAKHGAVAALVRSIAPESLDTPHTGATNTKDPTVPSAALTLEDATRIHRLFDRGETVRLHLELGAHTLPDAPSANTIGEVRGRVHPEEVVVLGCHLDSWDVGQGAQDDGAGCATVMGAATLIAHLPVAPKRTVRVVLYTNEENGLAGGRAYAAAHTADHHVAAIEVDTGAGQPLGFDIAGDAQGSDAAAAPIIASLQPVIALLRPIGVTKLEPGFGGADIGELTKTGTLSLGLQQDTSGYWPIHHTQADTFDKIDPTLLAKNVAATAVMAYALADMDLVPPGVVA